MTYFVLPLFLTARSAPSANRRGSLFAGVQPADGVLTMNVGVRARAQEAVVGAAGDLFRFQPGADRQASRWIHRGAAALVHARAVRRAGIVGDRSVLAFVQAAPGGDDRSCDANEGAACQLAGFATGI